MSESIWVIGAGDHAKVLVEALRAAGTPATGLVDTATERHGERVLGVEIRGDDRVLEALPASQIRLVNGVGSIRSTGLRAQVFERFRDRGYTFARVVHPSAVIAPDVELAEGAQVMAGAVLQPGCRIGRNAVVNTRAAVDHDCQVGDHVHLAPGVTLSGCVEIGEGTHVGTGASVIQGVRIGKQCLVGAGAVVVCDVPDGATVLGVPAKEVQR